MLPLQFRPKLQLRQSLIYFLFIELTIHSYNMTRQYGRVYLYFSWLFPLGRETILHRSIYQHLLFIYLLADDYFSSFFSLVLMKETFLHTVHIWVGAHISLSLEDVMSELPHPLTGHHGNMSILVLLPLCPHRLLLCPVTRASIIQAFKHTTHLTSHLKNIHVAWLSLPLWHISFTLSANSGSRLLVSLGSLPLPFILLNVFIWIMSWLAISGVSLPSENCPLKSYLKGHLSLLWYLRLFCLHHPFKGYIYAYAPFCLHPYSLHSLIFTNVLTIWIIITDKRNTFKK